MKNFINVRVQSYNYKKQYDLLRHNFRHKKDSLSQIDEKPNIFIGPNGKLLEIDNTNKKKIHHIPPTNKHNNQLTPPYTTNQQTQQPLKTLLATANN